MDDGRVRYVFAASANRLNQFEDVGELRAQEEAPVAKRAAEQDGDAGATAAEDGSDDTATLNNDVAAANKALQVANRIGNTVCKKLKKN